MIGHGRCTITCTVVVKTDHLLIDKENITLIIPGVS